MQIDCSWPLTAIYREKLEKEQQQIEEAMNPSPPKEEQEEPQPKRTVSKVGTNIGRVIYDQNTGIETMVRNQSSFRNRENILQKKKRKRRKP